MDNESGDHGGGTGVGRGRIIGSWVSRLIASGILLMGAMPKFVAYHTTPEKLAGALGIGRAGVTAIGVVEVASVILMLVPRTAAIGATLACFVMLGALTAHATRLGWTGETGQMWPMAAIALAAAAATVYLRREQLAGLAKR